jgi:hypothetical protein
MRKLALAVAAAALLTALPASTIATPATAAPLAAQVDTPTDVSSRHRHHWRRHHHWRHYGWHRGHHYGWYKPRRFYGHYGWHRW